MKGLALPDLGYSIGTLARTALLTVVPLLLILGVGVGTDPRVSGGSIWEKSV